MSEVFKTLGQRFEILPSGQPLFTTLKGIPAGELRRACDCCLTHGTRFYSLDHRGFGIIRLRQRVTFDAGKWAFCSECWELWRANKRHALTARVETLNPELGCLSILYDVLAQVVYGEPEVFDARNER